MSPENQKYCAIKILIFTFLLKKNSSQRYAETSFSPKKFLPKKFKGF